MNPRGHRGFAAVLMLLVLVLSAMALLPARAQAPSQVTGLVSQCGTSTTFVGGATVTLRDADGVLPSLTTTTGSDGSYSFTPPTANYTLSVTAPGYYDGSITTPFRFDGSATVTEDLCLTHQLPAGKTSFGVTFHVQDGSTSAFIGGATVSVYNSTRQGAGQSALIATGVTNATAGPNQGNVAMNLWYDLNFTVQVNATGFGLFIQTMPITAAGTITVPMSTQVTVVGHARNTQGQFVTAGLTATLYRLDVPSYNGSKVIQASVTGSLYTFYAPTGTYRMVVDANGYTAYEKWLSLTAPSTVSADALLAPSPQENYLTTVLFGAQDWNHLIIYRNWTLHPDSTVPGLNPSGFRDLRQQINFTFGNGAGNGTVSANDIAAFNAWLARNGPVYVTTDGFLLLNSLGYNSSMTSFRVLSVSGLATPGADVQVNTVATYSLKSSATISYGQPKYFLNMTVLPDTNTTVYHNETYIVQLPVDYELVTDTIVPSGTITTNNYQRITVDPLLGAQAIRMVLEQSTLGIARAQVVGPSGKFYVVNSTYQNYQAYVANYTNISFSAAQTSNPPSNDSSRDNFTWRFLSNGSIPTPVDNVRWGIQPTFLFPMAGPYLVNLTAVGSGGNVSYRNINIWVDGSRPIANFKTNLTGSGSAVGQTLRINESTSVKFDASLSTDQAYPGKQGVIPSSGYAWDFNGDNITDATGSAVTHTFNTPGKFTMSLNVTDAVGLQAVNATMTVYVNDTQPPVPGFTVLDPLNDFAPVTGLIEGHNYTFNASKTTDNYDKLAALNFTWFVHGPIYGRAGNNNTFYGLNVTWGWTTWNLSYAVTLQVNDTGFGIGKPNTGTLTVNESVQIDWTLHPDLYINVGTIKVDNTAPESGSVVTITLNVTNKPNRGTASQVYVSVTESDGGQSTSLLTRAPPGSGWTMTDKNGNTVTTIPSGSTVTLTISVTVVGQGNKTLTVRVEDGNEPYTAITSENSASVAVNVLQPAWVNYAIIGSVIAVFAVVIGAMYYRRKVKAGDWQPRFRRSKGEGGKEKPRKEREVKEEKKRL